MWVQSATKHHGLKVVKLVGADNEADLGTKHHTAAEHNRLMRLSGVYPMDEIDTMLRTSARQVSSVSAVAGGQGGVRAALIALLTAMVAETSEGTEVVLWGYKGTGGEEAGSLLTLTTEGVEMKLTWGFVLQFVTLAYLLAWGWRWLTGRTRGGAGVVELRSMQTQSQTTYRRTLQVPRFVPLGNGVDGAWAV